MRCRLPMFEHFDRILKHAQIRKRFETVCGAVLNLIYGGDSGTRFAARRDLALVARGRNSSPDYSSVPLVVRSPHSHKAKRRSLGAALNFGGDSGTRTHDLCVANASLYHLSYIPKARFIITYFSGCATVFFDFAVFVLFFWFSTGNTPRISRLATLPRGGGL